MLFQKGKRGRDDLGKEGRKEGRKDGRRIAETDRATSFVTIPCKKSVLASPPMATSPRDAVSPVNNSNSGGAWHCDDVEEKDLLKRERKISKFIYFSHMTSARSLVWQCRMQLIVFLRTTRSCRNALKQTTQPAPCPAALLLL